MTIGQWLAGAQAALERSASPDPRPDAEWILLWALDTSRAQLLLRAAQPLLGEALSRAEEALAQRCEGRPLQHVLGEAWFYGRRFACDARALIPRQDTELLCETAVRHILPGRRSVLDLCTGSGVVGVTLALERPLCAVTATDLSGEALSLARENAARLGAKVRFLQGDLYAAVREERFDAILSNPPYLTGGEMRALQSEVRYDPEMALFGGEDGLEFYRRIARGAAEHLLPGGCIALEIGSAQAQQVCALLREHLPVRALGVEKDLQGLDRVVWAHL
ncbi:MAG: peptide chain release factor N(5)-glutamine methyltransferase [Eubacteriales bacterium]|nr:peptide chain release factor N(5)-glutamine methyltransferase [Eubacteriales bacterium]